MKLLTIGLLFAEFATATSGLPAARSKENVVTTREVSVCSILRRPRVYRSKLVEIRANIVLAMLHGAFLLDGACPKRGIQLGVDLPKADASVANLISSLLNDCSGVPHPQGQVAGTFIGKLSYSAEGRLNLRLVSIRDFDVKPCPPSPVTLRMPPASPPT
jgi:hypothetical protein